MKYIMFRRQHNSLTHYLPIIFPNHLVHADVAAALMTPPNGPLIGCIPRSAGFYSTFSGECSADSSTMNLKSHPDDTHIIRMHDYGAGFE